MTGECVFRYELMASQEAVRAQIQTCEGHHVQQAIYSTFMDTLTQVCFTCHTVRSTIDWNGNRSWPATPSAAVGVSDPDPRSQIEAAWSQVVGDVLEQVGLPRPTDGEEDH